MSNLSIEPEQLHNLLHSTKQLKRSRYKLPDIFYNSKITPAYLIGQLPSDSRFSQPTPSPNTRCQKAVSTASDPARPSRSQTQRCTPVNFGSCTELSPHVISHSPGKTQNTVSYPAPPAPPMYEKLVGTVISNRAPPGTLSPRTHTPRLAQW